MYVLGGGGWPSSAPHSLCLPLSLDGSHCPAGGPVMFPVEPMTQPKLLPVQGRQLLLPHHGKEKRGSCPLGGEASWGPSGLLGFTKLLALFLGSMGLLTPSLEVSILTCWPDGKLRQIERLGSSPESQPMGDKSRTCLPAPVVPSASARQNEELRAQWPGAPGDWHSAWHPEQSWREWRGVPESPQEPARDHNAR